MKMRDMDPDSRRKFVSGNKKLKLENISFYPGSFIESSKGNCENAIGAITVPVGVAGPLAIDGENASGEFFVPLATTEGALVASVSRGCKALNRSGGAKVYSEKTGITRGAVYRCSSLGECFSFLKWMEESFGKLSEVASSTSGHLKLKKMFMKPAGLSVFVRYSFDTQDAMGMNMATIAVQEISDYIKTEKGTECLSIAGNFDNDKKPSYINAILGRGIQAWAECFLEDDVLSEVLKTSKEKIHDVWIKKCMIGSYLSGSMAFNAHFANVVAALFLATGQDMAHVSEGSLGLTTTEVIDKRLHISVYLPDLPVGTVGGGTKLPAQNEMLSLLGISGGANGNNASAYAEITAAAVLAGELSLLSSLSEGTLASSHEKLARGKRL